MFTFNGGYKGILVYRAYLFTKLIAYELADFEEGHIEDLVFMFSFGKIILPYFLSK